MWESQQGDSPRPPVASESRSGATWRAWGREGGKPRILPREAKGFSFMTAVSRVSGAWLSPRRVADTALSTWHRGLQ